MRNLEKVLKNKGISDEAVSKMLGIHRNTFGKKKEGESVFSIDEAFAIKRNLLPEYDLEYLFEDAIKNESA